MPEAPEANELATLYTAAFHVGPFGRNPLSFLDVRIAAMTLSLTGAYAIGSVGASLALTRRAGWRYAPVLPMAFALLHLSWGLGFLAGCIRFLSRWFCADPLAVTITTTLNEEGAA